MVKGANKIAIVYLIVGICWILFSDKLFANAPTIVQSAKGVSYVFFTAVLLWIILQRNERKNKRILKEITDNVAELQNKDKFLQRERTLLRTVIDNLPDYIFVKDPEGKILVANKALVRSVGRSSEEEIIGKFARDFFPGPATDVGAQNEADLISKKIELSEHEFEVRDSTRKLKRIVSTKIPFYGADGDVAGIVGISRDITTTYNKAKTDDLVFKIITALSENDNMKDALIQSLQLIGRHFNFKFAEAWHVAQSGQQVVMAATWALDSESKFHYLHRESYNAGEGLPGLTFSTKNIQIWSDVMQHPNFTRKERSTNENLQTGIGIPMILHGNVIAVFTFLSEVEFSDYTQLKAVLEQISTQIVLHLERKKHEFQLEESNAQISNILESISDGFFALNQDWTVSYWNTEAENMLNMRREDIVGRKLTDFYPADTEEHASSYVYYKKVMLEKVPIVFEKFYEPLNIWLELSVYPSRDGISVFMRNVSENRRLKQEVEKRIEELAISNSELEQFAYIASHDMQEPLRMVTGFLTQIEKRYSDVLDETGRQYIHFAVDGAVRMRKLILDLLEYSKVGKISLAHEIIDIEELIHDITVLNQPLVDEKNVTIITGELPGMYGGKTLIQQVFQNLIINAIKYKREGIDPIIHISGSDAGTHWKYEVADNGIGISDDYFDQVFVIFQRLHSKEEYSGTGIGLAICKKIVENHGGRIWITSQEGKGSTFYFTIEK